MAALDNPCAIAGKNIDENEFMELMGLMDA
jgi:hypothetical protein